MIYITGDTHGDRLRFIENNMGDDEWTENDTLIVCGDFGFVFCPDSFGEAEFLDYLETKPYTICFCDGNHENFPAIFSYPEERWNKGRIHRIRRNVIHLMRGQIYEIENKTFFTFGGAYSIDKAWRAEGRSWWSEELPTGEEYAEGFKNLKKNNYTVDYIITHTAPQSVIQKMCAKQPWYSRVKPEMNTEEYQLIAFLGEVLHKTNFKHWYFGHWHCDIEVDDLFEAVYLNVHKL